MSDTAPGARTNPRDRIVLAVILIAIGAGGFALQLTESTPDVGAWVVLIIGLAFLGVFAITRQYGFLVPAGILTGLGAGILVSQSITLSDEEAAGVITLGLGLGFLSVWLIGALVRLAGHHFWPLIPGGILAVVGAALLVGGQAVDLLAYWPFLVIAAGVIVLGAALLQGRSRA